MSKLQLIETNIARYNQKLYYLVGVMSDGTLSYIDGSHDNPQDVAKAKELYESISLYKDKLPARWVMVTTESVPVITSKTRKSINRGAIKQINKASKHDE